MFQIKKFFFVSIIGLGGLLLTFAGLNLIQLSQHLILYSGLSLLAISALLYFFM